MLSEAPEGWEITTIGSICEIARGGSPRPIDKFMTDAEDGINWIKIGDASASSKYIYTTKEKIKPEGEKKSRRVQSGDFLLSNSMSFGRPYILRTDGCIHDGWLSLSFDRQKLGEEFLYYLLSSPLVFNQFSEKAAGSAVKNLNKDLVSSVAVSLPPYIEQHRIAEILSSVDASIQATQTVITQAERVKRGLMEELLTGGLGSEAIERGEVPEGWAITKLADLTTKIGSGVTPKGGKKAYVESGSQLIRSQNVGWGEMLLDDVAFITPEQHEKMDATKLKKGDVLLNITGASIGRSAIYEGETGAANVNQHVCILRTKEVLAAGYLNAWLLSHAGQKTIDAFQAGGNRQGLNFQQIGSFPIPLPPLSEQQRIAEIISSVDELIAQQKSVIEQQTRTKRGLMDDLLTGKVRAV